MKRLICLLLVIALCLPVVLASCDESERRRGKQTETTDDTKDSEGPTENNGGLNDNGNNSNSGEDDDGKNDNGSSTNKPTTKPQDKPNDNTQNDDNNQNDDEQSGGNQNTPTEPDVDLKAGAQIKETYTLERHLFKDELIKKVEAHFKNGTFQGLEYQKGVSPFMPKGDFGFGNARLTSLTLPVMYTGPADANGNFILTLYVYEKQSNASAYNSTAHRKAVYTIEVSKDAYNLPDNSIASQTQINRIITIDLRSENITLTENQTIGLFSPEATETLYPMFFTTSEADRNICNDIVSGCSIMKGFYLNLGESDVSEDNGNVLYLDFTYETTYNTKEEYEAEVKAEFEKGKHTFNTSYMSPQMREMINDRVAQKELNAREFWMGGAPYAPKNDIGLSGTRLTSITIPVMSTGTADNGNYTFTLSVVNKSNLTTPNATLKKKTILISKELYGLTDNVIADKNNLSLGVYKVITVDLSAYDIIVGTDETLAFGAPGDTLEPIYIVPGGEQNRFGFHDYMMSNDVMKNWKGFVTHVGGSAPANDDNDVIFFDFTYEKVYNSADEYLAAATCNVTEELYWENFDEMLEAVKDAYGDKYLSVMGDSISTYKDIANNTAYNSTIGGNAIWYGDSAIQQGGFGSYKDTYWGNMLRHIEMKLCVDNAWSGASLCYPKEENNKYSESFVRAQNLHNNSETNPDLILVYYGINDTWGDANGGRPVGDLYTLLQNRGDKTRKQVVEEWIDDVLAKAEANNFKQEWNVTYSSWSEAYAIMLYLMTQKYPDAKVVLFELVENGAYYSDLYMNANNLVPQYNEVINALAAYFDMPVVKQYSVINSSNYEFYTHDWYLLHPNAAGHKVMFKELVYTLYTDLQKNK